MAEIVVNLDETQQAIIMAIGEKQARLQVEIGKLGRALQEFAGEWSRKAGKKATGFVFQQRGSEIVLVRPEQLEGDDNGGANGCDAIDLKER